MRRIERLINLIAALLETRTPMTAEDIRNKIAGYDQSTHQAFRRAFERDKEHLRAMGVPVELRRVDGYLDEGPEGYIIPKERYYLPQIDLEPDEMAALRIAAGALAGASEVAEGGILKLEAEVESGPSEAPRIVWGTDVRAEQPFLVPLYSALMDKSPVRFSYLASGGDAAADRRVEPYGLVHRRGHWYLVANDPSRRGIRAFKLSRIEGEVEIDEGSYEIPAGFDAKAHLENEAWEIGGDDQDVATVRFDASLAWWPEQNMPSAQRRPGPDGDVDVDIPFSNSDALVSWVLAFGEKVRLVAPERVRARLLDHLTPFLGEGEVDR